MSADSIRDLIRTKFGVEITINVLFDISTVAGPAALVDATQSTAA
ncbi:hypothetical protein [Amycolatopsis sp. NPDC048633]